MDAGETYTIVALVTPEGKIRHVPCAPQIKHKQLQSYKGESIVDGKRRIIIEYAVEPKCERQGFKLLRTMFEEEGRSGDWPAYEKHMKDVAASRRPSFPDENLPKAVLKRREEAARAGA